LEQGKVVTLPYLGSFRIGKFHVDNFLDGVNYKLDYRSLDQKYILIPVHDAVLDVMIRQYTWRFSRLRMSKIKERFRQREIDFPELQLKLKPYKLSHQKW